MVESSLGRMRTVGPYVACRAVRTAWVSPRMLARSKGRGLILLRRGPGNRARGERRRLLVRE